MMTCKASYPRVLPDMEAPLKAQIAFNVDRKMDEKKVPPVDLLVQEPFTFPFLS